MSKIADIFNTLDEILLVFTEIFFLFYSVWENYGKGHLKNNFFLSHKLCLAERV